MQLNLLILILKTQCFLIQFIISLIVTNVCPAFSLSPASYTNLELKYGITFKHFFKGTVKC